MSKGTIIGLIIAVVVIIAGVAGFSIYRNSGSGKEKTVANYEVKENTKEEQEEADNKVEYTGKKVLVVYYSAQTHTRRVAERIAKNIDADTFEIVPVNKYSEEDLDWTKSNSRVSLEHNDESLRGIEIESTVVPHWDEYDTILLGYPIWWAIAAWPTDTFVKANDFTGKTVIPFCTSYSSGIGQSDKLLKNEAKGGDWKSGQRFYQDVDLSEVDKWTNGLGL